MANLEQIKSQIESLERQKESYDKKIETLKNSLEKEQTLKSNIQDKIDKLTGNMEEEITTTSVGNASVYGGKANFSPKMGMTKRKNKTIGIIHDFLEGVF